MKYILRISLIFNFVLLVLFMNSNFQLNNFKKEFKRQVCNGEIKLNPSKDYIKSSVDLEIRCQFIQQAHKKCDEIAKVYFKTTDRIYSTTIISKSGDYETFDCYVKKEKQSDNIRILSDYTI